MINKQGMEIAKKRKALGLTQKALGEICGYNEQSIRNAETNAKGPSERLFNIAMKAMDFEEKRRKDKETVPALKSQALLETVKPNERGAMIAKKRRELCITQSMLAELCDYSKQSISNAEAGTTETSEKLFYIAMKMMDGLEARNYKPSLTSKKRLDGMVNPSERGAKIEQRRKYLYLSPKLLGDFSGYSEQAIRDAETRSKEPSDRLFENVMKMMDVVEWNEKKTEKRLESQDVIIDLSHMIAILPTVELREQAIALVIAGMPADRVVYVYQQVMKGLSDEGKP